MTLPAELEHLVEKETFRIAVVSGDKPFVRNLVPAIVDEGYSVTEIGPPPLHLYPVGKDEPVKKPDELEPEVLAALQQGRKTAQDLLRNHDLTVLNFHSDHDLAVMTSVLRQEMKLLGLGDGYRYLAPRSMRAKDVTGRLDPIRAIQVLMRDRDRLYDEIIKVNGDPTNELISLYHGTARVLSKMIQQDIDAQTMLPFKKIYNGLFQQTENRRIYKTYSSQEAPLKELIARLQASHQILYGETIEVSQENQEFEQDFRQTLELGLEDPVQGTTLEILQKQEMYQLAVHYLEFEEYGTPGSNMLIIVIEESESQWYMGEVNVDVVEHSRDGKEKLITSAIHDIGEGLASPEDGKALRSEYLHEKEDGFVLQCRVREGIDAIPSREEIMLMAGTHYAAVREERRMRRAQ